jgi:DNA-binding IclR family transcriptional regulator
LKKKQAAKQAIAKPASPRQTESAVGTLERGLAILQFFKRTTEASVADVAAALELSRSTTYRIAERLRELGFLEINTSNSLWRLGRETAPQGDTRLEIA